MELSTKPQKLIQPINNMIVGLGFLSPKYKQYGVVTLSNGTKMEHFGVDWWQATGTPKTLYAMGNGEVLRTGNDSTFGNIIVVRYNNCLNNKTNQIEDLIVRCYHLAQIRVVKGQKVTKDTILGVIGCTGRYCNGVHVHLEIDLNIDDPFGVPGITTTNLLHWVTVKKLTVVNPAEWVYTKVSLPDRQTTASAGTWYRDAGKDSDYIFPKIN